METKDRAPRNRTITLSESDRANYSTRLLKLTNKVSASEVENRTIHQDLFEVLDFLPTNFVDLLFIDPPYNMNKTFNSNGFKEMSTDEYSQWIDCWLSKLIRTLKPTASVYICGDWRSSGSIQEIAEKYFTIRNRITWE